MRRWEFEGGEGTSRRSLILPPRRSVGWILTVWVES